MSGDIARERLYELAQLSKSRINGISSQSDGRTELFEWDSCGLSTNHVDECFQAKTASLDVRPFLGH